MTACFQQNLDTNWASTFSISCFIATLPELPVSDSKFCFPWNFGHNLLWRWPLADFPFRKLSRATSISSSTLDILFNLRLFSFTPIYPFLLHRKNNSKLLFQSLAIVLLSPLQPVHTLISECCLPTNNKLRHIRLQVKTDWHSRLPLAWVNRLLQKHNVVAMDQRNGISFLVQTTK